MRGDRLKQLRTALKLSRQRLADDLGVGEAMIPRWESGETLPSADVVLMYAKYFGVSADWLLGLTDDLHGFYDEHLNPDEHRAIAAWRGGDKLKAVKAIVDS